MDFKGKNFCLTGFDSFDEESLKQTIEKLGGVIRSSAVKDLDYLIYHPQFGVGTKKYEKANQLKTEGRNVKILSINEFLKLIEY